MLIRHKQDNLYKTVLYVMHRKPHKIVTSQYHEDHIYHEDHDQIDLDQSIQSTSSNTTTSNTLKL